jgi:hypothetical protein
MSMNFCMLINRNIIVVITESVRYYFRSWLGNRIGSRPPHCRGFVITLRHTNIGSNPLKEWRAGSETSTWKYTTLTRDKHPCPSRIRTCSLSKRVAADPHLRRRGRWVGPVGENMQNFSPKLILRFFYKELMCYSHWISAFFYSISSIQNILSIADFLYPNIYWWFPVVSYKLR